MSDSISSFAPIEALSELSPDQLRCLRQAGVLYVASLLEIGRRQPEKMISLLKIENDQFAILMKQAGLLVARTPSMERGIAIPEYGLIPPAERIEPESDPASAETTSESPKAEPEDDSCQL